MRTRRLLPPLLLTTMLLAGCSGGGEDSVADVEEVYGALPDKVVQVLADGGVDVTCRNVIDQRLGIEPASLEAARGWAPATSGDDEMQYVQQVLCDIDAVSPDVAPAELQAALVEGVEDEGFVVPPEAEGRDSSALNLPPFLVREGNDDDVFAASVRAVYVMLPEISDTVADSQSLSFALTSEPFPADTVRDEGTVFYGE